MCCAKAIQHTVDSMTWHVYRYVETKHNNMSYWGLDYPPLSAYQVRIPPLATSC